MSGMTTPPIEVKSDFFSQVISLSNDLLCDIISQINDLSPFTPDKERIWNSQFAQISSDISQFVELTTLWARLVTAKKKAAVPSIKESHIHLLFILKAINHAQAKKDAVILDELIKYELKDSLTQWKIDLIPQMKNIANS